MHRPPGLEIYRCNQLSVYEVRGSSAPQYCSGLGLFARLFIRPHESLYASAVPQFTYYLLCGGDANNSCQLRGFFTKVCTMTTATFMYLTRSEIEVVNLGEWPNLLTTTTTTTIL